MQPVPESGLCVISAAGIYTNTVCEAATAELSATISGPESATARFSGAFVGTIGLISRTLTDNFPDSDTVDTIYGVVLLGPPLPPNVPPRGTCTDGFGAIDNIGATDSDVP
jgi:hypothetical protein